MRESQIAGFVSPILAQHGLDLDAVEVVPAGKRRLLRIVVDGDGPEGTGPLLDDIATATKAVSVALDDSDVTGNTAYTLEVSSRGVSRPLEMPRHWRRNVGRLVTVRLAEGGEPVTGRIAAAGEHTATVTVDGAPREIAYADVVKALIQIELNRPVSKYLDEVESGPDEPDDDDDGPDDDDPDDPDDQDDDDDDDSDDDGPEDDDPDDETEDDS